MRLPPGWRSLLSSLRAAVKRASQDDILYEVSKVTGHPFSSTTGTGCEVGREKSSQVRTVECALAADHQPRLAGPAKVRCAARPGYLADVAGAAGAGLASPAVH